MARQGDRNMLILGIGGWVHDGAAAIMRDGTIVAAIEEDKLSREAHRGGLPERALEACLRLASAEPGDVDCVSLVRPLDGPQDRTFHIRLRSLLPNARVVVTDHHDAHAASAYYASPFESARVLTLDRQGDMRCGALWNGRGNALEPLEDLYAPDSPAVVYSRVTELLGFRSGREEHKVQWLSMGGEPTYKGLFQEMMGGIQARLPTLDHSYFDPSRPSHGAFGDKFYRAIGIAPWDPIPETMRPDLAASVHAAVTEAVLRLAGTGENLCLAGGVAMNALIVEALERSGNFREVFVQPAAGNAGTAVGGVYHAWHRVFKRTERVPMQDLFLGPAHGSEEISQVLENCKLNFRYLLTDAELVGAAVERLADDQILAWFQGRTEFGPRALGNRSILASPLNPYSTENLNVYIKRREKFRKFAASVPVEALDEYFETSAASRYLATVSRVKAAHRQTFRSALLDGERIRLHVVSREDNRLYWELLREAGRATGLPVLYNTSFNLFGEPLVSDPRAAVRSFYSSGIDALFVGNFLLEK